MGKIHIHVQKQDMTWAGTPDEDRDHASRDGEIATVLIVIVVSRARAGVLGAGRDWGSRDRLNACRGRVHP